MLLLFPLLLALGEGALLLPQIFGSNMVLQTAADGGPPASLFGYAAPGEEVSVNMTIAGALTQYRATADAAINPSLAVECPCSFAMVARQPAQAFGLPRVVIRTFRSSSRLPLTALPLPSSLAS